MRSNPRKIVAGSATSLCCLVTVLAALPAIAGANRWTPIGPDGANVVALAIDPRTPSTAFAGTLGSGALKSVDGGASWITVNGGLPSATVSALAIDPSTPSTLFAGTDAGVFKSTDGGQSWTVANSGLVGNPQVAVAALAIDPGSPSTVYAATSTGVFKTTDAATTWTSINAGLAGQIPRVIAIDTTSPSTLYVSVDDYAEDLGNGVFKSTDAGMSWTRIYRTTPFGDGGAPSVAAIAIDPRTPSRLFLAIDGVVGSVDGGAHWSSLNLPQSDVAALAIDPASSATLYAGTYSGALFRTVDAGAHWAPVTFASPAAGINVIAIAASAPVTVFTGGRNGIFRSSDGGETWARLTLGVRNVYVGSVAVDPSASSTIYATLGSIVTKTTNGGAHWTDSEVGVSNRGINHLVIDPASPATLYAGMESAPAVFKSTDGGMHWAAASNGLSGFGGVQAFAIAPSQPSTLYVGMAFAGVAKSSDGGSSWVGMNNGLTAVGIYVSALAVDPKNAEIVYVATPPTGRPDTDAKIFKSTNGAAQWRQVPIALPTGTLITSLAIDPATTSVIYAAYVDYPTGLGGVFKSSDSGETWIAPQQLLPTGCCVALVIDPSLPSQMYAATEGGGVFTSTDGATSWSPLNAGLPSLGVSSLAIDQTGTLLRAAAAAGLFEYQVASPGAIGPGFTGSWYDPAQSGHGIFVQILSDQRFYASWFAFNPAGTHAIVAHRRRHLQRQHRNHRRRRATHGRALDSELRSQPDRAQPVGHAYVYVHRLQSRQSGFQLGVWLWRRKHESHAPDAAGRIDVSVKQTVAGAR